jgi:Na+-driven multidrug efflux pump
MDYAVPYLRCRAAGMVPVLFASTSFAAYWGLLNTVMPLRVSLTTNLLNLALDPLFIFGLGRGGAATPVVVIVVVAVVVVHHPVVPIKRIGPLQGSCRHIRCGAGLGAVRCKLI